MQKPTPAQVILTADMVLLRPGEQGCEILLIQRGRPPFAGMYALPGGKVNEGESVDEAASRELAEETGITGISLEQIHVFSTPSRDPRGRYVSVSYLGLISRERSEEMTQAGDDAAAATWHAVQHLPPLAFDHQQIIAHVLEQFPLRHAADLQDLVRWWQ
ncbi:NUDIX domain-containing protein [Ktedonospora formicarum]|uniref:Nudix hydrolase domain-containing protein n=1 Tax=Ktedonospora formicarum TaxID=2778364 RepID=A0A8J3MYY7_9CHLR|nr:NUDIX hydrolase [Ktedonospora formicarum]GHO51416.1 hypothetical protein KSX_95790 [Ktedonospora formicarum]